MMSNRPTLSEVEYLNWRKVVHDRCGVYFTPSRRHFLESRLWERLQYRKLKSYTEYYHFVLYNADGDREWGQLLDLLLNNESSFFRHTPSFTALTEHVLPDLMQKKGRLGINTFSMWSAGCANGQEAYSLAIAFLETAVSRHYQLTVWGTDISQRSLQTAKKGIYKPYDIRNMPPPYLQKYMQPAKATNGRRMVYQLNDTIQKLTQFSTLNLTAPERYALPQQDVIFCQNVLIYFQPEDRKTIVERLCDHLAPNGYLFLAPAEMIRLKIPDIRQVKLEETLIYQREGR